MKPIRAELVVITTTIIAGAGFSSHINGAAAIAGSDDKAGRDSKGQTSKDAVVVQPSRLTAAQWYAKRDRQKTTMGPDRSLSLATA